MILAAVLAAAWGVAVAGLGAWLTDLSPWYHQLRRPSWQPPDWLFGPAWTLILGCASLAAWLGWRWAENESEVTLICALFIVNGVLNILWSPLFFTWRRPDWALLEVPFLWLSVLALVIVLWPVSHAASYLMMPYLVWVAFAAFLNLTIVRMNRPFQPV